MFCANDAVWQPANLSGEEGEEVQADLTLDRAAVMEDCSRLALETEQSLPIAQTVGEALAVLGSTVLVTGTNMSPHAVAAVSAEVASLVTEAEGLVDGLFGVIQVRSHLTLVCFDDERPGLIFSWCCLLRLSLLYSDVCEYTRSRLGSEA